MLESQGQRNLIKRLKTDGWFVVKISLASITGFPDLLCLKSPGKVKFIECKVTKGKITDRQRFIGQKLISMGFDFIFYDVEKNIEIPFKPIEKTDLF